MEKIYPSLWKSSSDSDISKIRKTLARYAGGLQKTFSLNYRSLSAESCCLSDRSKSDSLKVSSIKPLPFEDSISPYRKCSIRMRKEENSSSPGSDNVIKPAHGPFPKRTLSEEKSSPQPISRHKFFEESELDSDISPNHENEALKITKEQGLFKITSEKISLSANRKDSLPEWSHEKKVMTKPIQVVADVGFNAKNSESLKDSYNALLPNSDLNFSDNHSVTFSDREEGELSPDCSSNFPREKRHEFNNKMEQAQKEQAQEEQAQKEQTQKEQAQEKQAQKKQAQKKRARKEQVQKERDQMNEIKRNEFKDSFLHYNSLMRSLMHENALCHEALKRMIYYLREKDSKLTKYLQNEIECCQSSFENFQKYVKENSGEIKKYLQYPSESNFDNNFSECKVNELTKKHEEKSLFHNGSNSFSTNDFSHRGSKGKFLKNYFDRSKSKFRQLAFKTENAKKFSHWSQKRTVGKCSKSNNVSSESLQMLFESKSSENHREGDRMRKEIRSRSNEEKVRIQSLVQRQMNMINQHVKRQYNKEKLEFVETEEVEKHFDGGKVEKVINREELQGREKNQECENRFRGKELKTLGEMEKFLEHLKKKDLEKRLYKGKNASKELSKLLIRQENKHDLSSTLNCKNENSKENLKTIFNKNNDDELRLQRGMQEITDKYCEMTSKDISESNVKEKCPHKDRHKIFSEREKSAPNKKENAVNDERKECRFQKQNYDHLSDSKSEKSVQMESSSLRSSKRNYRTNSKIKRYIRSQKQNNPIKLRSVEQKQNANKCHKANYESKSANGRIYRIKMASKDRSLASDVETNTYESTLPRGLKLKNMYILGDEKLGLFNSKFLLRVKGNQIYLEKEGKKPKHKLTERKQNSTVNPSQLKYSLINASAGTNSEETGGEFHCFSSGRKNEETVLEEMESLLRLLRLKKKMASQRTFDSESHASRITDRARDERRAKLLACMNDNNPEKTARLLKDLKRQSDRRQSDDYSETESKKQKLLQKVRADMEAIISDTQSRIRSEGLLNVVGVQKLLNVTNNKDECEQKQKPAVTLETRKTEQKTNEVTYLEKEQVCTKMNAELRILNALRARRKGTKTKTHKQLQII